MNKPYYVYQLQGEESLAAGAPESPDGVLQWLNESGVRTLNIAGPREGKHCPVYDHAYGFLTEFFTQLRHDQSGDELRELATINYSASGDVLPRPVS